MPDLDPTPAEWRQLYAAATEIMRTAPWQWMTEDRLFGVQNPETGEIGFVSVMGHLGEHLAVAVYRGPRALYDFMALHYSPDSAKPERIIEMEQLQAVFADRDELTDRDRRLIKELGLKFRGRQAWPYFRSHRHGHWPWYLEAAEARFLAHALEQATFVVRRLHDDPALLDSTEADNHLVRVLRMDADLVWEDQRLVIPPEPPPPVMLRMDSDLLAQVKQLPRTQTTLEIDYFMFPAPIGNGRERPLLAKMVMVVDHDTGMVVGSDLLHSEPGIDDPLARVPLAVVQLLARWRIKPARVLVSSWLVEQLMQVLGEELGYTVEMVPHLEELEAAREFLFNRMM